MTRIRRLLRVSVDTISELLELSRADAGALQVRLIDSDLSPIIREVIDDYRGEATEKSQRVDLEEQSSLCVRTDLVRARQILGNLVSNAVKFTPKNGRILVRVVVTDSDQDSDSSRQFARVEVHDSGPGIPPVFRARVFDEFFRLPSTEHVSGTGIGLTISKTLATLIKAT